MFNGPALRIEPDLDPQPEFALMWLRKGKWSRLRRRGFLAGAEAGGHGFAKQPCEMAGRKEWPGYRRLNQYGVMHADEVVIAAGAGAATLPTDRPVRRYRGTGRPTGSFETTGENLHTLLQTPNCMYGKRLRGGS